MNRVKNFLGHHPMKPIMNRTIIFSLFLVLLSAWPVWGATYYVKNGGNDSLNGFSDATAWATIAKVSATVKSGDTVYFRSQDTWSSATMPILNATAGVTYDGSTYGSGTRATFSPTATDDTECAIYANHTGITIKGINLNGGDYGLYGGLCVGRNASAGFTDVNIDNCEIQHIGSSYLFGGYALYAGTTNGYLIQRVTLTNNNVHDNVHEAIAVYPSWQAPNNRVDVLTIRGNTVYNAGTGAGGGCICVNNAVTNALVEFNSAIDCGDFGIDFRNSSDNCSNIPYGPTGFIVRYNIVGGTHTAAGIRMDNPCTYTMNGSIYSNIVYGSLTDAWAGLIHFGHNWTGTNSTINLNSNTILLTNSSGNSAGIQFSQVGEDILSDLTVNMYNNIIYTSYSSAYPIFANPDGAKAILNHGNNLYWNSSGTGNPHVYWNGVSYDRTTVKSTFETSCQNSNPTFTDGTLPTGFSGTYETNMVPNTTYFAISSGDALNNGATLGSPYNGCINGAGLTTPLYRPAGAYDIGAYEYNPVFGPTSLAAPTGLRVIGQ